MGLGRRLGRRQRTSVIASQPDRRNLGRRRPASPRQPPRRRAAFFRRQPLRRQLSGAASISSLVFSRSQPPRPFASSSPSIAYSRRQRPLTASASSSPPSPVFAPACSVQPVAQVSRRTGCSALLSSSAGWSRPSADRPCRGRSAGVPWRWASTSSTSTVRWRRLEPISRTARSALTARLDS